MRNRITSDFFIESARKKDLEKFFELIGRKDFYILSYHTNGEGGVGKTRLLKEIQDRLKNSNEYWHVIYNDDFIDFYHSESRSKIGVMRQIVEALDSKNFPEFSNLLQRFRDLEDPSLRDENKLEKIFIEEYQKYCSKMSDESVIVLFFDTYEAIQAIGKNSKKANSTLFSDWLEEELFIKLINTHTTRLVISGRYKPLKITGRTISYKDVKPFQQIHTEEFLKKAFGVNKNSELSEKIGINFRDYSLIIRKFHKLIGGRPILLALTVDSINNEDPTNRLYLDDLIRTVEDEIGCITNKSATLKQRKRFEKELFLVKLDPVFFHPKSVKDKALSFMAIAYRRMTPELLSKLLGIEIDECKEHLKELRDWSFIKKKSDNLFILHDEMRRLLIENYWDEFDGTKVQRKRILELILSYYKNKLDKLAKNLHKADTEIKYEIYQSERIEYSFIHDPNEGLNLFKDEFDIGMDDGKYDYCDFILRIAEKYQNKLNTLDSLRVPLRRIRYYNDTDQDYKKALKEAEQILSENEDRIFTIGNDDKKWEETEVYGHFLLQKGISLFWLERFDEAIENFKIAKRVYIDSSRDEQKHWVKNWIGYAYYRKSMFNDAEEWLIKSIKDFHALLNREGIDPRRKRKVSQVIQYCYGNLSVNYSHKGAFDKAVRFGEIPLNIVRYLPRNSKEIARSRNTVGTAFVFAGRTIDANYHLIRGMNLISEIDDRTLLGRLKSNLCFVKYRISDFAYLLEYYRAKEIRERARDYNRMHGEEVTNSKNMLKEVIDELKIKPEIDKELADAYYALGELCIVEQSEAHWEEAEKAFRHARRWAKKSKFTYRFIDTLESLITLYYFWNGRLEDDSTEEAALRKRKNDRRIEFYKSVLESYEENSYPNLYSKLNITFGDMKFDLALKQAKEGDSEKFLTTIKECFEHYVKAINLMYKYNKNRYYLIVRVLYNRLNTLLKENLEIDFSKILDELKELANQKWDVLDKDGKKVDIENFASLFDFTKKRTIKENGHKESIEKLKNRIKDLLQNGEWGWAVLFRDLLIGLYNSLRADDNKKSQEYTEEIILQRVKQSGLFRLIGDEFQAKQCLDLSLRELDEIRNKEDRRLLEACILCGEATWLYRRGEYGKLIEYYLKEELTNAREKKFKAVEEFETVLDEARDKLIEAIKIFESFPELSDRYKEYLGEAYFRLGELYMLTESPEAVEYLEKSVDNSTEHRKYDAMESVLNAIYFSGKSMEDYERYKEFIEELSVDLPYPTVLGKLRITEGDNLFSQSYKKVDKDDFRQYFNNPPEIDYIYVSQIKNAEERVRKIFRYYVEACNYMAKYNESNFNSAVRVLQRRIEILGDKDSLESLWRGLRDIWLDEEYKYLQSKDKRQVLDTLVQFAEIRSIILRNELKEGIKNGCK